MAQGEDKPNRTALFVGILIAAPIRKLHGFKKRAMAQYTSVDTTFHSKLFNENGSKIHENVRKDEKIL